MKIIGYVNTDFKSKFGIPRQSGLIEELKGVITFEKEYSQPEAFRGLEEFTHIWVIWGFSANNKKNWSATVTPPRLGGKERKGVFATRSPFRPNPIGLSCLKLDRIEYTKDGTKLHVSGVDMLDNTPIYDIKPYIPYADAFPNASEGYTALTKKLDLEVEFPQEELNKIPEMKRPAIIKILENDPRPAYDSDENMPYGVNFSGFDIRFKVKDKVLTVFEVIETGDGDFNKIKQS